MLQRKQQGHNRQISRSFLPKIRAAQKRNNSVVEVISPKAQYRQAIRSKSIATSSSQFGEGTVGQSSKQSFNAHANEEIMLTGNIYNVNLENLLKQQKTLEQLTDKVGSMVDTTKLSQIYHLQVQDLSLSKWENLFGDECQQRHFRAACNIEFTGMALLSLLSYMRQERPNPVPLKRIQSLALCIHENFLVVVNCLMELMPRNYSTKWVLKVKDLYRKKSSPCGKYFASNFNNLRYQTETIQCSIQNISSKITPERMMMLPRSHKQLYDNLFSIAKSPERYTWESVLDMLQGAFNSKVLRISRLESRSELQTVGKPALPPKTSKKEYTLILDLDETLVHYTDEDSDDPVLNVRPNVRKFLKETSQLYEVVIFTAAVQEYADWAIDELDPEGRFITHRLYRHNQFKRGNRHIKDLSRLGRNICKTLIVDNLAENFALQPDNGITIKTWFDDPEDTALTDLLPLLIGIAEWKVEDVRVALQRYRAEIDRRIDAGIPQPHLKLRLTELLEN